MKFKNWLENKNIWLDFYNYLLGAEDGIYEDPNYHNNVIDYLRLLGLDQDANELEMVKISQKDIDFSNKRLDFSQPNNFEKRKSSRVAYNTYMNHIEYLIKKTRQHIEQ